MLTVDTYTFTRWKRYGHDRAYVSDETGTSLGYVDLRTGIGSPERGHDREHLELLVLAWRQSRGFEYDAPAANAQRPTTSPPAPPPDFTDLSGQRPGDAAGARAQLEWDAYHARRPVASRIARFLDLNTPDRSWARGAAGEIEVGRRLEQLWPEGWRVLHAVPVGSNGADIDHLLIGPAGVFCINTKNHSRGKVWIGDRMIMVNGAKTDYLRNSRFEGRRVSKTLTNATGWRIDAQPALVFLAREYTMHSRPADVHVVGRREVPAWFRRRPATISDEAVAHIYDMARRSTTWDDLKP